MKIDKIFNEQNRIEAKRLEAELKQAENNLEKAKKEAQDMGEQVWLASEDARKAKIMRPDNPGFDGSQSKYSALLNKREQIVKQAELKVEALKQFNSPLNKFLADIGVPIREYLLSEVERLKKAMVAEGKQKSKTHKTRDQKILVKKTNAITGEQRQDWDVADHDYDVILYTVRTNYFLISRLNKYLVNIALHILDNTYDEMESKFNDALKKIEEIDLGLCEEKEMSREDYQEFVSMLPSNISVTQSTETVGSLFSAIQKADTQKAFEKIDELKEKARK